jgi:hypothetical protein
MLTSHLSTPGISDLIGPGWTWASNLVITSNQPHAQVWNSKLRRLPTAKHHLCWKLFPLNLCCTQLPKLYTEGWYIQNILFAKLLLDSFHPLTPHSLASTLTTFSYRKLTNSRSPTISLHVPESQSKFLKTKLILCHSSFHIILLVNSPAPHVGNQLDNLWLHPPLCCLPVLRSSLFLIQSLWNPFCVDTHSIYITPMSTYS